MSVSRLLAIAAFVAVFVVALGIEWAARRSGSKVPTLAVVCRFAMRHRVGRITVLACWCWLGWHFLAR